MSLPVFDSQVFDSLVFDTGDDEIYKFYEDPKRFRKIRRARKNR